MTGGEARVDARNDRREGPSRDGRTALGRLSRRASFVLVAGAAGAASSIVLTLSTGFAQSLPARFPWLLLALPVLGALSVGLYRLLRLPAALTTEGVVDELRAGRRVPGSLTVGILGGSCLTLLGGAAHCLLVGLCCAVGGALFAACLRALRRAMRRRAKARPFALVAVGGLAFAGIVLACGWQAFQGTGMGLLRGALAGSAAPADFAVKAGLTVLVLGFGFKGGEIMPMFSIGALLGCSLGLATGAPAGFSAALGMAAFFAAAGRCPLTALLMGAEIFGWSALPFLLIAVAAAYAGSYDVGVFGRGAASELARVRRRARRDEPSLEEDR